VHEELSRQDEIAAAVGAHVEHHVVAPQLRAIRFGFFEEIEQLHAAIVDGDPQLHDDGVDLWRVTPTKNLVLLLKGPRRVLWCGQPSPLFVGRISNLELTFDGCAIRCLKTIRYGIVTASNADGV
jgi:hypothetical protein